MTAWTSKSQISRRHAVHSRGTNWPLNCPFALYYITVRGLISLPWMLPQPSPPSLSAFINSCCSVRLHLVTCEGHHSPRGACGATPVPDPAGFCSWPCPQCLFSLTSLFGHSCPCSSSTVSPKQLGHFHTCTPTGKHTVH